MSRPDMGICLMLLPEEEKVRNRESERVELRTNEITISNGNDVSDTIARVHHKACKHVFNIAGNPRCIQSQCCLEANR